MTEAVDVAVVAHLEDGEWQVAPLPPRVTGDIETLVDVLRRWPTASAALGMVAVDEDFFILARVQGDDVRLMLSDITAATQWPLARTVVDELDLPLPDDDDPSQPAGDLGLLADWGMGAMDLGALCDDVDLYPDEMLAGIAGRLGFSAQFDTAVDIVS